MVPRDWDTVDVLQQNAHRNRNKDRLDWTTYVLHIYGDDDGELQMFSISLHAENQKALNVV